MRCESGAVTEDGRVDLTFDREGTNEVGTLLPTGLPQTDVPGRETDLFPA